MTKKTKLPTLKKLLLALDAEDGKAVIDGQYIMRIGDYYFFTGSRDYDKPHSLAHAIARLEGRDGT